MPYIIDGHNLIPKLPGLELSDIDDESRLIELLQEFCRRQRKRVEVYFDNAPPVERRAQSFGAVTARFVRQGTTADAAIRARLARLGRSARNWTVVSSDQEVQAAARRRAPITCQRRPFRPAAASPGRRPARERARDACWC
jgi:uncharacterized protein